MTFGFSNNIRKGQKTALRKEGPFCYWRLRNQRDVRVGGNEVTGTGFGSAKGIGTIGDARGRTVVLTDRVKRIGDSAARINDEVSVEISECSARTHKHEATKGINARVDRYGDDAIVDVTVILES